jgi:hypothetical protein
VPKQNLTKAQEFQDAVNREEIYGILRALERQTKRLSGNHLEILKKFLKQFTDY